MRLHVSPEPDPGCPCCRRRWWEIQFRWRSRKDGAVAVLSVSYILWLIAMCAVVAVALGALPWLVAFVLGVAAVVTA